MSVSLSASPVFSWFTPQGLAAAGYQLFTYVAGTSTPQATYTDYTQTTQNLNPVVLNSFGYASVWLVQGETYKLVLEDNLGNLIWSVDQIPGGNALTQSVIGAILYPQTAAEIAAGLVPTSDWYPPGDGRRYTFPVVGQTHQQFQNTGANIWRLNDRVLVGDAAVNDGNYPNVTKDWLSAFQTSSAYGADPDPNGTALGCQMVVLADHLVGGLGGAALFGAESINQTSAGDILATNSFAINNNASYACSAWAHYAEAWRCNNITGSTIGFEMDVVQQGQLAQLTPYGQNAKEVSGFLAAAGAGKATVVSLSSGTPGVVNWNAHGFTYGQVVSFSSTYFGFPNTATLPAAVTSNATYYVLTVLSANTFTIAASVGGAAIAFASSSTGQIAGANQFPATVAYYIGANPVPFDKGIVINCDAISGTTGADSGFGYAINMAKGHLIQWWAPGGVPTGSITSTGTSAANASSLQFGEGYAVLEAQNGLPHTYFRGVAGAVNYLNLYHSSTGNPVAIGAGGTDTNIDLELLPQGTGNVRFGTYSATTFAQTGYISIKDSSGNVRRLMVG